MPETINLVDTSGTTYAVPVDQADAHLARGWRVEAGADAADRVTSTAMEDMYGGPVGTVVAGGAGLARGLTLGGSDVLLRAAGAGQSLRGHKEVNPVVSGVTEVAGGLGAAALSGGSSLLARTPAAAATRLGASIAEAGEGLGMLARVGRAAAGGTAEGALYGAGQGVSELALSEDPLTFERAASTISSNMLFGGAIGGAAGSLTKLTEIGLTKARGALEKAAAGAPTANIPEDLAALDRKGLRAAEEAEHATIETARVPQRTELADDVAAFRKETLDQKLWLATKGIKEREISSIGKISLDADKAIDRVLRNPKKLATDPKFALAGLQQQEHALELLVKQTDNLTAKFAADTSGERLAALNAVPAALERNRALQARIGELVAPPASPRLAAIKDATDALAAGGPKKGLVDQMVGGSVFGAAAGLASAIPVVGPYLAPLAGAAAARLVSEKVFGRLAMASREAAGRTARAVGAFMDVTGKVAHAAPVLATKVLANVSYAPATKQPARSTASTGSGKAGKSGKTSAEPKLADVFKARAAEVRSQTTFGPTGVPELRREARTALAARLAPIRAFEPLLADRMETLAARRIEFLSHKLPRRPDLAVLQTGPDTWQPSDLEMRTWARYAAAVEDPGGVEERLAAGTITPEDAEAMRAVYPERMAEITRQIVQGLPMLQRSLPYSRRLALSIFSGVPVDAAMHPRILSVLQGQFAAEEGSEGGMQAPRAQPQFGSIRADKPTPAQERA